MSTHSLPVVCTGERTVSVAYADVITKLSRIDRFPISNNGASDAKDPLKNN